MARRSAWWLVLGAACALLACAPRNETAAPRIVLVSATATPESARALQPVGVSTTPAAQATVASSPDALPVPRIAVTAAAAAFAQPALDAARAAGLSLSLDPVASDADALASSDDLALMLRLPGMPPVENGIVVRRQPLALALPFTLAPDDLTLSQAVGLLTGTITNWSQVGSAPRPVRLAETDPTLLAKVGALVNAVRLQPVSARVADARTLLAELESGSDELAVLPWTGPWLRTKALRIDGRFPDDPGYPLVIEAALVPLRAEATDAARQIGARMAAVQPSDNRSFVLLDAMGDFMLARGVAAQVQQHGVDWPFAAVRDRLASADLHFGNLEFALTDRGTQANKDYTFRAPPSEAQVLARAGIDVVDLANNHVLDYGAQGLFDTLAALDAAGVRHVGAGADDLAAHRPLLMTVNGVRIAWLAYANVPDDSGPSHFVARSLEAGPGRPGVAWGTLDAVRRDVAAVKQQADVVIVALHAGLEYTDVPNTVQRDLAHAAIDAGAALVLGAHPHVLQGIEFYKGGVIAYSLGNFVFDYDNSDRQTYGMAAVETVILRVALTKQGVAGLQVYPAIISATNFRPEPVYGQQARPVFDRLERLTAALNAVPQPSQ